GGELLTGSDLAVAMKWIDRQHSAEWAARYGGNFEGVVKLVERSLKAKEQDEMRAEQLRRQELRRARRLQAAFGVAAAIFLLLLVWVWRSYKKETEATITADRAKATVESALKQ